MKKISFAGNDKKVPIVILNWNGWEDTAACIDSIYAAETDPLIWVVDNKSESDKSSDIKRKFPSVIFIMNDKNYGWAVANNIAIEMAMHQGHSHIYLLNNDCIVEVDFLSSSLQKIENDIAAIGSYIISICGDSVIFDGKYTNIKKSVTRQNILKTSTLVNGAGMLVNIAAFYQTGKFDERYFCYHEETEWCERAWKLEGFKLKVNLASVVRHVREGSDIGGNSIYYRARNSFIQTKVRAPNISVLVDLILERAKKSRVNKNVEEYESLMCAIQDGLGKKFNSRGSFKARYPLKDVDWISGEIEFKRVVKEYYKL